MTNMPESFQRRGGVVQAFFHMKDARPKECEKMVMAIQMKKPNTGKLFNIASCGLWVGVPVRVMARKIVDFAHGFWLVTICCNRFEPVSFLYAGAAKALRIAVNPGPHIKAPVAV